MSVFMCSSKYTFIINSLLLALFKISGKVSISFYFSSQFNLNDPTNALKVADGKPS